MTRRDLTGIGTPEDTWRSAGLPEGLPVLEIPPTQRVVVLAPHPDDELLGCGGTIRRLHDEGREVVVLGVTAGEGSHAGRSEELRGVRAEERARGLEALGIAAVVHDLGLPDARVDESAVVAAVGGLVQDDDLVLAPWHHDGHPDHDAVGRAARALPGTHRAYLVWAWHWATPAELPAGLRRVGLETPVAQAKRAAVAEHVSQLEGPDPILPGHVLARLLRDDEVFLP